MKRSLLLLMVAGVLSAQTWNCQSIEEMREDATTLFENNITTVITVVGKSATIKTPDTKITLQWVKTDLDGTVFFKAPKTEEVMVYKNEKRMFFVVSQEDKMYSIDSCKESK